MKPDGWSELPLADLAEIAGGGTPKRGEPSYWNGNVAWATPTDVTALTGRTIRRTASTITEAGLAKSSATLLPPGSLLLTTRATIGVCAIAGVAMATNQGFQNLVPRHRTCVDFLYYLFHFNKRRLERLGAGSTFREVSKTSLRHLRFLVPPLSEQRKIAAILSSVDDAIERTQAVIDQMQVVKRGLMQELLTRGLPGLHSQFRRTEIGEIPEEWQIVPLTDVGSWFSGGTPSRQSVSYWGGSIPWVSGKDMKHSRLGDAIEHVSMTAVSNGTRLTPAGSILVVVRGMILAHTFPVAMTTRKVAFNQDLKALVTNDSFDPEFLLYWLQYRKNRILALVDTATHGTKRLPTAQLFAQLVPLPQRQEQKHIAEFLRSNDSCSSVASANLERLAILKRALMSVLLTGELRVTPDPESE